MERGLAGLQAPVVETLGLVPDRLDRLGKARAVHDIGCDEARTDREDGKHRGGLIAFGLVGIFVGPLVLAVSYRLIEAWVNDEHPNDDATSR